MWHWGGGPEGLGWLWMALMMALFWVPVWALAFWALRAWTGDRRGTAEATTSAEPLLDAREIARRAYARGEYGRERYLEIMADLEGGAG